MVAVSYQIKSLVAISYQIKSLVIRWNGNNGFSIAPPTIGPNGFTMVFGPATIAPDVFQWFSMVTNHWSNDGMVKIHRYGLNLFFYLKPKLRNPKSEHQTCGCPHEINMWPKNCFFLTANNWFPEPLPALVCVCGGGEAVLSKDILCIFTLFRSFERYMYFAFYSFPTLPGSSFAFLRSAWRTISLLQSSPPGTESHRFDFFDLI